MAPAIVMSNVTVTEGDSGLTPFTVDVSYSYYYTVYPVTVRITATPGTASESDYVFPTTEVTVGGDAGTQTVSGFIVGDILPEGDETFYLTATVVRSDGGFAPYFYSSGGFITIKDDDQARASKLHVEGVSVLEGNYGVTKAEVRVVLEPASASTVTVAYTTKDGTATAKSDYVPTSGGLTFAPGEVLKTVTVDIIADTTYEPDETFSLVLSQPSMALLGDMGAIVIVNDDVAPTSIDTAPAMNLDGAAIATTDAANDTQIDKTDLRLPSADTAPVPTTATTDAATASGAHLSSGCACTVGGRSDSLGGLVLAGLVATIVWRRKRQQRCDG